MLDFPCDFPIKIMGKASLDFQAAVLDVVRRHIPTLSESAVEERYSQGGQYLALTIILPITDQTQLDAIYSELSGHPLVLMVL